MAAVNRAEIESLDAAQLAFIGAETRWLDTARAKQLLPLDGWKIAIARAGRGFGKTAMGSNWVRRCAHLYPGCVIHIVAATTADLTGTMMNGVSGILAVTPPELIAHTNFSAAIPTITFTNGSTVRGFSAQSYERLRGPQCTFCWSDEVCAWGANGPDAITQIDMSTRIAYRTKSGELRQPQRVYTSTPKPLQWFIDLLARAQLVVSGSTYENKDNLAEDFLADLEQYRGTKIGDQEIFGKVIDVSEAAIIRQSWLKVWPNSRPLPWFDHIFISMDTAFTEKQFSKKTFDADPTCLQVYGVFSYSNRWNVMLLERWSDHVGFPELLRRTKKELKAVYGRRSEILFKPMIGREMHAEQEKRPDTLIIEAKGSGLSLRQMLSAEGIESWPYNPGKADKLSRLHNISHVAANGRIWLPESTKEPGAPRNWILPMLDEVCVYSGPGTTKHDDDVDCFSMGMRFFADRWMIAGVEGVIKPGTMTTSAAGSSGGEEWIPGQDKMPDEEYVEEFTNPYG